MHSHLYFKAYSLSQILVVHCCNVLYCQLPCDNLQDSIAQPSHLLPLCFIKIPHTKNFISHWLGRYQNESITITEIIDHLNVHKNGNGDGLRQICFVHQHFSTSHIHWDISSLIKISARTTQSAVFPKIATVTIQGIARDILVLKFSSQPSWRCMSIDAYQCPSRGVNVNCKIVTIRSERTCAKQAQKAACERASLVGW